MSRKRAWKLQEFVAHNANVNCLALGHKSGRVLVTAGDDNKINFWAVGKPNCIMTLNEANNYRIQCVCFDNKEELLCSGSLSGSLKIWDLEASKLIRTLAGHKGAIKCIDFLPFGDFLSSGSVDNNIKLWDIRRKGCIFTYKGHNLEINSLKFSPDGHWIASAGEDGAINLWDLRAGKLLSELRNSNTAAVSSSSKPFPVLDLAFHPRDLLLVSASKDKTVKFWDLDTFQMIASSEPDTSHARCLLFRSEGDSLMVASNDSLKSYIWEPSAVCDSILMGWSNVMDMARASTQLIGAACHDSSVSLYVIDMLRVKPLPSGFIQQQNSTESKNLNCCPESQTAQFQMNEKLPVDSQTSSKSTSRRSVIRTRPKELNNTIDNNDVTKLDVTTKLNKVNTSDGDIGDVKKMGYENVFHPRQRELNRTPTEGIENNDPEPFAAPSGSESESVSTTYAAPRRVEGSSSLLRRKSRVKPRDSPSPSRRASQPFLSDGSRIFGSGETILRSNLVTDKTKSCLTLAQTATTYSEPRHEDMNSAHHRSTSAQPRMGTSLGDHAIKKCKDTSILSRQVPSSQSLATPNSFVEMTSSETREDLSNSINLPKTDIQVIPMNADKPSGLQMTDFLPVLAGLAITETQINNESVYDMYGKGKGLQSLKSEHSESEMTSTILKGHNSMMTVLIARGRQLEITQKLWQNKDAKTAVDYSVGLNDPAVVVDLLSVITLRPSIWNLDLCLVLLNPIGELIQSKYETYITVGGSAIKLILKNFASVIKSNIDNPIQTVGVDISREERHNKCMQCYRDLVRIRSVILKRQTVPGKLGHTYRELAILMQYLD